VKEQLEKYFQEKLKKAIENFSNHPSLIRGDGTKNKIKLKLIKGGKS